MISDADALLRSAYRYLPSSRRHWINTSLDMGKMTIYGQPGSRSPTINWAAYELDMPFEDSAEGMRNPHPFGQIPCLVDNDAVIFESAAILIYLLSKINPIETVHRAAIESWIMWANASLDSICFVYNEKGFISGTQLRNPNKHMDALETVLSKQEYLVDGGFSLADVAVSSYLLFVPQFFRDINLNRWPNVVNYMIRCASRDCYGKAYSRPVQNFVVAFLKNMPDKVQDEKKFFDACIRGRYQSSGIMSLVRRSVMTTMANLVISIPIPALAVLAQPMEGRGGAYGSRVEGAGDGIDLLTLKPIVNDVVYPPSLVGVWRCQRELLQVDGDTEQAEQTWIALGGLSEDFRNPEAIYLTNYISSQEGIVLDRGFETFSRQHEGNIVKWNVNLPNTLAYGPTELAVVQRHIELPNDEGWGFDELVRITGAAGGIFGDTKVMKVARVKRRYRRAYTDNGDRIVEGLEIMKTYRVLDGIAGELPTSTTKSRIKMIRPSASTVNTDGVQ